MARVRALPFTLSLALTATPAGPAAAQHEHQHPDTVLAWRMPRVRGMPMMTLPGMAGYVPTPSPFLPGAGIDPASLPLARAAGVVPLSDGDTLRLEAGLVRRAIAGRTFVMYGFNGQYPGPLIHTRQAATIVVVFRNALDLPTTVHWHGVRLENRFDGMPGVTQDLVQPGEQFVYHVYLPDAGIYWYHPHHREDIQQELGLYGNILVDSPDPDYYGPANREEPLILDDLLLRDDGIEPFGRETATRTLMGRFGNVFLINGEPAYRLDVRRGEVVRFFVTNVSNTRIYNVTFDGAPIKIVGGDIGRFEREAWVPSIVIVPAERYIAEVRFDRPGTYTLTNRVQAVDHLLGEFYPEVDTLGTVVVSGEPADPDLRASFAQLRAHDAVSADIARYRPAFDRDPDFEAVISVRAGDLPSGMIQYMSIDTTYFPPVEWNDAMPMMNWVSDAENVEWLFRDPATGKENMDIDWTVSQGQVAKIRLRNDANAFHPMSHPIHLHGQRFLVVARDGVRSDNLVWKETVLVPVGSTVDLLVDASNPGKWMMHCHIAEHLEAGMRLVFTVTPAPG